MMKDLVIIAGPTAVGKSSLAVKLAGKINGSIISADSMQVYKGMDIGTAKITEEEMEGIPHYLIDVLDPAEDFNIVRFKEMATDAINEISAAGRVPMIVGGTGFYIQSVLYDIDFTEEEDGSTFRDELTALIDERGSEYVHKMLEEADPVAAQKIHHNDHKRMIRALEYHRQTGMPISAHNEKSHQNEARYNFCYFFLDDDRQKIYERINSRVDKMIADGLVDEVKTLMKRGLSADNVSMHGLGYKEIIDYLDGNCDLKTAVMLIKKGSRHFAKRQLTWSRREKDVIRLDLSKDPDVMATIMNELDRKGIINGRSVFDI